MDVTGNLERQYLYALDDLTNKKIDIFVLYGTDGIGGVASYYFVGSATAVPSDVGGVDEILEMTASITQNSAPTLNRAKYTITDNEDGSFTVAAA